jgi:hypothetical protein
MHPTTYRIRLLFRHPSLDFKDAREALSKIPGLNLGRLMNAGEERVSPLGRKLEGKYFDSRWGFDFETSDAWRKSEDESICHAIEDMLQKLSPYKKLLDELASKGCALQLIVSIGVDSNTAHGFCPDLLQKLCDLNFSLWFDLYPPDPVT